MALRRGLRIRFIWTERRHLFTLRSGREQSAGYVGVSEIGIRIGANGVVDVLARSGRTRIAYGAREDRGTENPGTESHFSR